jgi:ATP-dependent Clp protease ATP-binding subunit ClpA
MFQRYTENARRVIFYARYEASQYGNPYIDTEHIFLGLLREDVALIHEIFGPVNLAGQIRAEIEEAIEPGERISTFVEMPLTDDAKKLLNFAVEEADSLGHPHVGTEHLLLGILHLQDSLAAKLLVARGAKVGAIREKIAKRSNQTPQGPQRAVTSALAFLDGFLRALRGDGSNKPEDFFDARGQFVDSYGKRYIGREEIQKEAERLFARFAKKNASFRLEDTADGRSETVIASAVWELAAVTADRSKSLLRMSIVLASTGEEWAILLAQVTPILPGLSPAG